MFVVLALLLSPAPLEIEWQAPEECPGADDVRASVERTLGPAADDERTPIRASGRVQQSDAGYRLLLEVHDGAATSQRELEGATCREVTDAAALILAMTIDPRVALTDEPPAETTETEAAETKTVVPEVATKRASERVVPTEPVAPKIAPEPALKREPIAVHFLARAMAGLGVGPLPGPSASLALALGIGGELWRVEAVGHYWPRVEGDAPDDSGRRARASLWSVGARGCVVPEIRPGGVSGQLRRVLFPICTGVDAGMMRAEAVGLEMTQAKRTPWAAVVLGAGAEWWPIRNVGIGARVDGHGAVYRPRFVTDPSGLVHKAAPVGVQVLGGLLVRAP
jgi:hypothetical protein